MTISSVLEWLSKPRNISTSSTSTSCSNQNHKKSQWRVVATHPLELVHTHYPCLELGKGKEENVLVVTDHITQDVQVYMMWLQIIQVTVKALLDNLIVHYGLLEKMLSDQGRNWRSELIANLCRLTDTKKLRTSPYHPKTSGHCGRLNSTIINMLGTLPARAEVWLEEQHQNTSPCIQLYLKFVHGF